MSDIHPRKSDSDERRDRALWRDVVPAVVVLVLLQGSLLVADPDGDASATAMAWSLLPLVPVGWLVVAQVRRLRRADELQRIVQLEAMAVGFATMAVVSLAGGLLHAADVGDPAQSLQLTFVLGTLAWIGALAVRARIAR